MINSSATKWYIVQPFQKINLTEYISQHYKDQNIVTQSLTCVTDVEQEETDTKFLTQHF
jgi:hypothetical protein